MTSRAKMVPSLFAQALTCLLDESKFFENREQWAEFLGITPAAVSQWVNDKTVPRANLLRMVVRVLRSRGGGAAQSALAKFDEMARLPSQAVSPLGERMQPTIQAYLQNSTFVERAREEPVWPTPPAPPPAAVDEGTGKSWLGIDLMSHSSGDRRSRPVNWETLLQTRRGIIVGGTGSGKSALMQKVFSELNGERTIATLFGGKDIFGPDGNLGGSLHVAAASSEVVIVDGLDEIPAELRKRVLSAISARAADMPDARLLFASRPIPELSLLEGFERFSPAPLTSMQIITSLTEALDHAGRPHHELKRFICHLSESRALLRAFGNPLFLKTAWSLFERNAVTPFSEKEIIGEFVRSLLERDVQKDIIRVREPWASSQNLQNILGSLSFHLAKHDRYDFSIDEVQQWIDARREQVSAAKVLQLLEIQGFARRTSDGYAMQYAFLRDYFAAQHAVEGSEPTMTYLDALPRKLDSHEVIRLACTMTTDATPLLRSVLGTMKNVASSNDDEHVLLAKIFAQPVTAAPDLIDEGSDHLVSWLDAGLEGWSLDLEKKKLTEGLGDAYWELNATGPLSRRSHEPTVSVLTNVYKARSGPADGPLRVRMKHSKSPILREFSNSLDIEGRFKAEFSGAVKSGRLYAAVREPQLQLA